MPCAWPSTWSRLSNCRAPRAKIIQPEWLSRHQHSVACWQMLATCALQHQGLGLGRRLWGLGLRGWMPHCRGFGSTSEGYSGCCVIPNPTTYPKQPCSCLCTEIKTADVVPCLRPPRWLSRKASSSVAC